MKRLKMRMFGEPQLGVTKAVTVTDGDLVSMAAAEIEKELDRRPMPAPPLANGGTVCSIALLDSQGDILLTAPIDPVSIHPGSGGEMRITDLIIKF